MVMADEKILKEIKKFQERISYKFKDDSLLIKALTHRSYLNKGESYRKKKHNERLEFLGDSVLGLVITEYLFLNYPKLREGPMTKIKSFIVSKQQLYELGRRLKMEKFMFISTDERSRSRKHHAIVADCVEAVIAAIYLDGGLDEARAFILENFDAFLHDLNLDDLIFNDFKSIVQQIVQKEYQELPIYTVMKEKGPEHNKTFVVQLSVNGNVLSRGSGSSKKRAEQKAAQKAYKILRKRARPKKKVTSYLSVFKKNN